MRGDQAVEAMDAGWAVSVEGTWGESAVSLRWGESPAASGKYVNQIGSEVVRSMNRWLREVRLPPGVRWWRTADPGHLHLRK